MAEVRLPKRIMNSGGWCQGCGHGVVVRLIAEVLDELGVAERCIRDRYTLPKRKRS